MDVEGKLIITAVLGIKMENNISKLSFLYATVDMTCFENKNYINMILIIDIRYGQRIAPSAGRKKITYSIHVVLYTTLQPPDIDINSSKKDIIWSPVAGRLYHSFRSAIAS